MCSSLLSRIQPCELYCFSLPGPSVPSPELRNSIWLYPGFSSLHCTLETHKPVSEGNHRVYLIYFLFLRDHYLLPPHSGDFQTVLFCFFFQILCPFVVVITDKSTYWGPIIPSWLLIDFFFFFPFFCLFAIF